MKIEISNEEIVQRLKLLFKDEYSEDATEVLLGVLSENDHAYGTLFKMSLGIKPVTQYEVGDEVLIEPYSLNSWKFDKEKTIESKYAYKELVICKILSVNKYAKEQYKVTFTALDSDDKPVVLNTSVSEESISAVYEAVL